MKTTREKRMIKYIKLSQWIQKELAERVSVIGMPCCGKTTFCRRLAAENQNIIYIEEPYEKAKRNRLTFGDTPYEYYYANLSNYVIRKSLAMASRDAASVGRVFLEDRGPVDSLIFNSAVKKIGEITEADFQKRTKQWNYDFPEWLVFCMLSPEKVVERAKEHNPTGHYVNLPFLEILYKNYENYIRRFSRANRTNLKVFDMSGDLETNYQKFADWFKNERY